MPIALRLAMGKEFCQGPFKIGMLQPVVNAGAIIYMVVSVVSASMLSSCAFNLEQQLALVMSNGKWKCHEV